MTGGRMAKCRNAWSNFEAVGEHFSMWNLAEFEEPPLLNYAAPTLLADAALQGEADLRFGGEASHIHSVLTRGVRRFGYFLGAVFKYARPLTECAR